MDDLHDILLNESDFDNDTITCTTIDQEVCVTYKEYKAAIEAGEAIVPMIDTDSTSKSNYKKCIK